MVRLAGAILMPSRTREVLTTFNDLLEEEWVKQGKCKVIDKWIGEGTKRRRFILGFERISKRSRDYKTKYLLPMPLDWEAYKKGIQRQMAEAEAKNAAL